MSNFKSLIVAFQTEGDRSIIEEIIDYVQREKDVITEIKRDKESYPDPENVLMPTMFIARKIRSLFDRALQNEPFSRFNPEYLNEYNTDIYRTLGFRISHRDRCAAFYENYEDLRRFLGDEDFGALQIYIQNLLRYIDDKQRLGDTVLDALELALSKTKTSRHEHSIVKFIDRTIESAVIKLQMELTGTIRLGRRDGENKFQNVYVKPRYRKGDELIMIFGEGIGKVGVRKAIGSLAKTQQELVERMYGVIAEDFNYGDWEYINELYKVDEEGHYKIKYRYLAGKLGMEESNLRKQVTKIKKKIADLVPVYIN